MQRKDRVLEALRSLCTQRPASHSPLRRHAGFSAEEVAELAEVDRTNASRDLNLLAQQGMIERIPGRPVLFTLKAPSPDPVVSRIANESQHLPQPESPLIAKSNKPLPIATAVPGVVANFEALICYNDGLKVASQQAKAAMLYPPRGLHTLLCGPSGVGKTTSSITLSGPSGAVPASRKYTLLSQ